MSIDAWSASSSIMRAGRSPGYPSVEPGDKASKDGSVLLHDHNSTAALLEGPCIRPRFEVAVQFTVRDSPPGLSRIGQTDALWVRDEAEFQVEAPLCPRSQTVVDAREHDDQAVAVISGLRDERREVRGLSGLHITEHESLDSEGGLGTDLVESGVV